MRPVGPAWLAGTVAVAALILGAPLHAQDAHYWTAKYGPRASLLGGAVIGSVNDMSAAFYNPGGLAMADSLGFALSLNVFERTSTTAEGGMSKDDVSVSRSGLAPSMLGGAIKGPESGDHVFAYSLLTRQRIRNSISVVRTDTPPGFESVVSQFNLTQDASERWIGLSWAHAIRPNLGIGATGFFTMKSDLRAIRVEVAGSQANEGLSLSRVREFDYDHYGAVAKVGALLDYGWFAAGLTLTAPSLSLYGTGKVVYSDINVGIQSGGEPPLIAVAAPNGLSADQQDPFSVGLGLRGGGATYQLYGSAEWFASVEEYDVIRSGTFAPQSSTGLFEYIVTDERTSVLNWAIALEKRQGETVTTYVSFATDYSSSQETDTNLAAAPWDIRTVSVGADFRIRGRSLTLGQK